MATTATDDGPGLRPCPFCGGEAEMDDFHICCAGCGARLDFYGSPDAVARWNRRDGDRCAAGCVVRALADEVTGHMHSGPPGWPQTPEEEAAGPPQSRERD